MNEQLAGDRRMSARGDRPSVRIIKPGTKVRPRYTIGEWISAWKTVIRDPEKPIPDGGIPPEGRPIPDELDIQCQECGCKLAGAAAWVCPACGEEFNPMRLYTLRMMQQPEYFLRYRLDPDEIRKAFYAFVLVVLGFLISLVATVIALKRGSTGWLPLATAWRLSSLFVGLAILPTLLLHFALDISWARVAFFFAVPWFLLCTVLLVLTCI
jgi:predicted RNA-binding Zn-ribbon protein involved in translation (DUF1610 family)